MVESHKAISCTEASLPEKFQQPSPKPPGCCLTEEKQLKTMEEQVDGIWKPRLAAGDPFEGSLQNARVMLRHHKRSFLAQLSERLHTSLTLITATCQFHILVSGVTSASGWHVVLHLCLWGVVLMS